MGRFARMLLRVEETFSRLFVATGDAPASELIFDSGSKAGRRGGSAFLDAVIDLSLLGVSSRSLPVWKRTLLDGERGGVTTLSSGSSGIRLAIAGSEQGAASDVSLSPPTLDISSVVLARRRLTTLVFFLRPTCDLGWVPEPRLNPALADWKLTSDGRDE